MMNIVEDDDDDEVDVNIELGNFYNNNSININNSKAKSIK